MMKFLAVFLLTCSSIIANAHIVNETEEPFKKMFVFENYPNTMACSDFDNIVGFFGDCNSMTIGFGWVTDAAGNNLGGATEDPADYNWTATSTVPGTQSDNIGWFDTNGDGSGNFRGNIITYTADELVQGCTRESWSMTVTVLCPDGTAAFIDFGTGQMELTNFDPHAPFGAPGPNLYPDVANFSVTETPGACGVAPMVQISAPNGEVCFMDMGTAPTMPACDGGTNSSPLNYDETFGDSSDDGWVNDDCSRRISGTVAADCEADVCCTADVSAAPAAPAVVESTCEADGVTLSGGSIAATTCDTGATAEYSTDGGATWSTTVPTYNQTTAITVDARCNCDSDGSLSPEVSVTTVPGTCPTCTADVSAAPAAPAVVESTCEADGVTLSGGSIAATTCDTGATAEYSTDGGATWSTTVPTYNQTTAITVDARCNCDADGSLSPEVSVTTVPGTCPTCTADVSAAPAAPAVVESTCEADGVTLSGGSIAATTCDTGATAEYSTDGGATWSTTVPTYNQTTAMTVNARCNCDGDGSLSPEVSVTTVPGICPTGPDVPTVGQWGLTILGLGFLILGIVGIRKRKTKFA